jgi:predicted glycogen debranching enzyme
MSPAPGEGMLRYVGDRLGFSLVEVGGSPLPAGWRVCLRTNLGRSRLQLAEQVQSNSIPLKGAAWHDLHMQLAGDGRRWQLELPLTEVGFFEAKAYAVDPHGRQFWPAGPNLGISVHPDEYRTRNTIYCAFTRLFGETRSSSGGRDKRFESKLEALDQRQFTVIPPSGKLRNLVQQVPHIMDELGCRILHLLPVNPTPTTYARMGRFGSPYAALDLTGIDPALIEFDRRTTGVDQFRELTHAVHIRGGRLFLDLAINHTGWGSNLQAEHPDWFLRDAKGCFISPGAWGTVWEDLCELDHRQPQLWRYLAEVFLVWCRRGVDGFRCDAGYKVPVQAWQYITSRIRQEFPDTIFLLEGLGGAWSDTERLLTAGGMQWAYSELFQNYSGREVAGYLDYSLRQSQRLGLWVHYSETHDNDRLARKGPSWSRMRNQLCALTSASGSFGFTCGVEWLATEKINVHHCPGLAWGSRPNLIEDLQQLNRLLAEHPCFFDHAVCTRLSEDHSPVYALRRDSAEGIDRVLVLVNTDPHQAHSWSLGTRVYRDLGSPALDLLGQPLPAISRGDPERITFQLEPAAAYCLSSSDKPRGLWGEDYRQARAQAAWAYQSINQVLALEDMGPMDWRVLAGRASSDPVRFLGALSRLNPPLARSDLQRALESAWSEQDYHAVIEWELADHRRVTPLPVGHWLLVRDQVAFCASLYGEGSAIPIHHRSIQTPGGHLACFSPQQIDATAAAGLGKLTLVLERAGLVDSTLRAAIQMVSDTPRLTRASQSFPPDSSAALPGRTVALDPAAVVLLTNGRGGMARLGVHLGAVQSKYDCLLGANLHPQWPVDRHIFAKRARAWINADGFISPLDRENLVGFRPGPPAEWRFVANAGDGRTVEVQLTVDLLPGANTAVMRWHRPGVAPPFGQPLPSACAVGLTVRIDIEDRNFHQETHYNGGADYHFNAHTRSLTAQPGFLFAPTADRRLKVYADQGLYHPDVEWSHGLFHAIEATRGQVAHSDAFSPGWFDLPLPLSATVNLVLTAEMADPKPKLVAAFPAVRRTMEARNQHRARIAPQDLFGHQLVSALHAFIVRRQGAKTVIAGYPWFLDWGRDTLVVARGMVSAGLKEEVAQLLILFGGLERSGTLPNSLHGDNTTNRDTSDAPLWFGLACEETAAALAPDPCRIRDFYESRVDPQGRPLHEVLRSIAVHYCQGTPNGIRMDPDSGLVWSPSHFTWMDTQYPAGTPREGYPVEIQALWIRLLRQLERLGFSAEDHRWGAIARRAENALTTRFWVENPGWFADLIAASPGQPAAQGNLDPSLRCNALFLVSLGLVAGSRARRTVDAVRRHLIVPGAVRSLAPLPAPRLAPLHATDGRLINDPRFPYWGIYEGDEDTRRKPAYHNGTAWTWLLPVFCESLARAWDHQPAALNAARAYLRSLEGLLGEQCLGQIPEILDGDAPHRPRGCDAQAWAVSEALRVWKYLGSVQASD